MSKRSKENKPALADWQVSLDRGEYSPSRIEVIPQSWWKRTKPGWYTFCDEQGTAAEFAPGTVLGVRRVDARPPIGEDEARQSGYEITGRKGGE